MRSPSIGRVNTTRPSLGFSFLPPPTPPSPSSPPPIPWVTAPGADVGWKNNSSPAVGDGEGGGGGGGGEPTREPEGAVGRGGGWEMLPTKRVGVGGISGGVRPPLEVGAPTVQRQRHLVAHGECGDTGTAWG